MTDDMYAGSVAATRILARVPRSIDFCARTLGSQSPFLRHKLLDPGDSGIRYCSPTLQHFCQAGVIEQSVAGVHSFLSLSFFFKKQ
jgi:hypothetical protein